MVLENTVDQSKFFVNVKSGPYQVGSFLPTPTVDGEKCSAFSPFNRLGTNGVLKETVTPLLCSYSARLGLLVGK